MRKQQPAAHLYLGLEGGGTRTTLVVADAKGKVLSELTGGPGNLRLLTDAELLLLLQGYAARLPRHVKLSGLAIGLAGARTPADMLRIQKAAQAVWPEVPCYATNDLDTALAAAPEAKAATAQVLVLSGTGSCCFGRNRAGETAKIGGRGHVIGDRGSACDIGQRALKALMAYYDHTGQWPLLGQLIMSSLQFTDKEDLIPWSMIAGKTEIAALAICVFSAAKKKDPVARELIQQAALALAEDGSACAARLAQPQDKVQFVFNGGVLLKNRSLAQEVTLLLKRDWPQAIVQEVKNGSAWGAYRLAKEHSLKTNSPQQPVNHGLPGLSLDHPAFSTALLLASPTEQRNPRSAKLSSQSISASVRLMLREDAAVPAAILREQRGIVSLVEQIIRTFQQDGRLFYVGAGTSGRLGILDASECPPTFRVPREQVQGIIAGGQRAIWSAVEGAEDDLFAGADAIRQRGLTAKDLLVGLAASGRTPYVWGALAEAKALGAYTALICFNPGFKKLKGHSQHFHPDQIIAPDLGPEVLTGSTRLKSGTATKLILNILTTLAMTHTGKVISNLMVDLNPSNVKLRLRAVRILSQLTGRSEPECQAALEAQGWVVKTTYEKMQQRKPR